MLPGSHTLQALAPKDLLKIRRGSCVRHRFAKSSCRQCFEICPSKALEWRDDGLNWDLNRCQGCLLCTASCPAGALQGSEISFVALLQELTAIEQPILACSSMPETVGHARLPCLGILADPELLLAVTLALGRSIRLNLTACTECQNAAIIVPLEKAVQQHGNRQSATAGTVELIFDTAALDFVERSCSRREFFNLLHNRSKRAGVCVADRLKTDPQQAAYGTKQLPPSRQLLLQVLQQVLQQTPDNLEQSKNHLFPRRITRADCRTCTGCVGICPTGALLPPTEAGAIPNFSAERCIGCRLCQDFCMQSGLEIIVTD